MSSPEMVPAGGAGDELLQHMIDSIMASLVSTLNEKVWSRPDAAMLVEKWLSGDLRFWIDRDGTWIWLAEGAGDVPSS